MELTGLLYKYKEGKSWRSKDIGFLTEEKFKEYLKEVSIGTHYVTFLESVSIKIQGCINKLLEEQESYLYRNGYLETEIRLLRSKMDSIKENQREANYLALSNRKDKIVGRKNCKLCEKLTIINGNLNNNVKELGQDNRILTEELRKTKDALFKYKNIAFQQTERLKARDIKEAETEVIKELKTEIRNRKKMKF